MMQKIVLFFTFPFFVFGTIEVVKPEISKKQEQISTSSTTEKAPSQTKEFDEPTIDESEDDTSSKLNSGPNFLDPNYNKQFFRILIFICLLILFGMITIYIYKRSSPIGSITKKNSRNNIKILERRSLSPQTYLYHIQVGDKQFILSESKVEARVVATMDFVEN